MRPPSWIRPDSREKCAFHLRFPTGEHFRGKMTDEEAQALAEAKFLEHILSAEGIGKKRLGHDVAEFFGIVDLRELLVEFVGNGPALFAEAGADIQELCCERFGLKSFRRLRRQLAH